ncbi:MAG: c-type cytochrome biogenesis protein CcsB [Desulfobacteraceae bacterium]|nr:c-type cytochrome biogenesis protein CcsB [Desulfobacteraceae bacterium]MBU4054365.1 c-type cytochrome biogenesis protein CcsB [Pseudomonadota bacterium]
MNSNYLLSMITFVYGLASVLYVVSWIFKKPVAGKAATWILGIAIIGHTAGIGLRWVESYQLGIGHAPLSNMYESLVFFAWMVAVLYLYVEIRYRNRMIGAFTTPISVLALAYASLPSVSNHIQPLVPALKSNWLIAHVATCFLGYAAFALAFGISIMYLFKESKEGVKSPMASALPDPDVLDELTYQMIITGFLFLTLGIITGSVWANDAWGSYWSWDPKETWSLITWLIYASLLHARLMRGWAGKRIAWLSIVGFSAVMFTYFGVNLLSGLHSYAS